MITRRAFLQSILAAGIAPAVCKAGILMPVRSIVAPAQELFIPQGVFRGELGEWEGMRIIVSDAKASMNRLCASPLAAQIYSKALYDDISAKRTPFLMALMARAEL